MKKKKGQARLVEILVILLIVVVVALYVAVPRLIKSARQVENITDIRQLGIATEEEPAPIIPIAPAEQPSEQPIDLSENCNRENLHEESSRVTEETNALSKVTRYLAIVRCHRDLSQRETYSTQDFFNYFDTISALITLAEDTPSLQADVREEVHSVVNSFSRWEDISEVLGYYYEASYKDNDFIVSEYIEVYNEKMEAQDEFFIQYHKYPLELRIIRWYMEEFNFIKSVQITAEEKIEILTEIHDSLEEFKERQSTVLDERSNERIAQLLNSMQLKIEEYESNIG